MVGRFVRQNLHVFLGLNGMGMMVMLDDRSSDGMDLGNSCGWMIGVGSDLGGYGIQQELYLQGSEG